MTMQEPPVGRRREDRNDYASMTVSAAPPWDAMLERLDRIEQNQTDLVRMVLNIHEALPAATGFAMGQGLALGSPIESREAPGRMPQPPPIIGTPPPLRVEMDAFPATPTPHVADATDPGLPLAVPAIPAAHMPAP